MKKQIIISSIVLSVGLGACSSQKNPEVTSVAQDITFAEDIESDKQEETEEQTKDDLPEYAKVGQIVSGDKWSIALLYAKEYDSFDSSFYSETPTEGNKFLALFFDIKNISSKNDFFNSLYFEGYCDDYSVSSSTTINNPDGFRSIGGDVDSGKMAKGVIVYEVPENWNMFEISYKDGIWTTHREATFIISKNELSPIDYTYSDSVYEKYVFDENKKTESGSEIESENWNIKLLDVKRIDETGGTLSQKAEDGNEFVIFFMEAKNVSDEDDYFNTLYFRSYVNGYLTNPSTLLSDIDGEKPIGGDVAKGKITKGYLAIKVQKGWESIELIYDDGVLSENRVAEFAIINE